jgi:hypothetical protein
LLDKKGKIRSNVKMPPLQSDFETIPLMSLASKLRNHVLEMRKRRRVTFGGQVSVNVVPDIPLECRKDIWMAKHDFVLIRRECAYAIIQATVGGWGSTMELRGLETSASDEHFLRSYGSRKVAIAAVLEEQEFQRQTGYHYPEDIAAAYKEMSAHSVAHAILVAQRDEIAARDGAAHSKLPFRS